MPKVSVIMPVYNGERFLTKAVDSILRQSFTDFEFIIIDDGSTDSSKQIISGYSDPRIKLLSNQRNLGIIESLNRGIAAATGSFICRMDADDISAANRFQVQLDFLRNHPKTAAVGSSASLIDPAGNITGYERHPSGPEEIMNTIFVRNPFTHGTMMIRSSVIDECGKYDPRFVHTEDYDLWLRIASRYPMANVEDILLQRRIHGMNVTVTKETALVLSRVKTLKNAIFNYYRKPSLSYYLVRPAVSYVFRLFKGLFLR